MTTLYDQEEMLDIFYDGWDSFPFDVIGSRFVGLKAVVETREGDTMVGTVGSCYIVGPSATHLVLEDTEGGGSDLIFWAEDLQSVYLTGRRG